MYAKFIKIERDILIHLCTKGTPNININVGLYLRNKVFIKMLRLNWQITPHSIKNTWRNTSHKLL